MHMLKSILAGVIMAGTLVACGGADTDKTMSAAEISEARIEAVKTMSVSELMESATDKANTLSATLAGVSDEASARAAIADVRALVPELTAMADRLGTMDKSEMTLSLNTIKDAAAMGQAQMKMAAEITRVAAEHPELRAVLEEEFGDFEVKLNSQ